MLFHRNVIKAVDKSIEKWEDLRDNLFYIDIDDSCSLCHYAKALYDEGKSGTVCENCPLVILELSECRCQNTPYEEASREQRTRDMELLRAYYSFYHYRREYTTECREYTKSDHAILLPYIKKQLDFLYKAKIKILLFLDLS